MRRTPKHNVLRLCLLILAFLPTPITRLTAQPGTLDIPFPQGGSVAQGFGVGTNNFPIYALALQNDGKIMIGGYFFNYNGMSRDNIARLTPDGRVDDTFNPGNGANSTVYALAIQSDEKILIGGAFTSYNGTARNHIARLNPDGTLDVTFNPGTGTDGDVRCLVLQSDGKILIGGGFTSYNGTARSRIARLNPDGTLDASFNPGSGASSYVFALAHQSDGKILIGGAFTSYNGTARNRIARVNADGTLDATFNPGSGANSNVFALALQSDGRILIGGAFSNCSGAVRNRIARLNAVGTLDVTFDPGGGFFLNWVYVLALQSDGKIMVGGDFTQFGAVSRNRIARINTDGTLDATFNPGSGANDEVRAIAFPITGKILIAGEFTSYNDTARSALACLTPDGTRDVLFDLGYGANSAVFDLAIQSDGKILIGGWFTSYNGTSRNRIARLNADGTLDASFVPGLGASASVSAIVLQSDGKILIGGAFTSYNGTARNHIARLNPDGTLDVTFNPGTGTDDEVRCLALQSDGKILIGGGFSFYNGSARSRIARLNPDGTLDASFNPGSGASNYVFALAHQSDGKILIGGIFSSYNGTARNCIARLNADGTLDATFNPGTGANSSVFAISLQSDGKILIGGALTSYNGTSRNRIARLNPDGTLDASFIPGLGASGSVYAIALQSDGKILIGGAFTSYNGTARNYIARLNADGTLDATFNNGNGLNDGVSAISLQSDGKILIGGYFTLYDNTIQSRITRLNPNGSLEVVFSSNTFNFMANGRVVALALQGDGKILIGGNFTGYHGVTVGKIARLHANGWLDNGFSSFIGADGIVQALAIQTDGKILIGGGFTSYNVTARNRIARLNTNGTLDATFDPGAGANAIVYAVAVQSDGKILIGGNFSQFDGVSCNRIARLNSDGTLDVTFVPGLGASSTVSAIVLQSDGKILISGYFTSFNGTSINRIARLNSDGSLDATFNPGTGASSAIMTLKLQSDGKIIAGGQFTSYNGISRGRLIRINSNGTLDAMFNTGGSGANGAVQSLALQSDGKILVGGVFTSYNGTIQSRITRLEANGTLDATFTPVSGASLQVEAIALQNDGKIIIGGNFTSYDGQIRKYLARLNGGGLGNPLPVELLHFDARVTGNKQVRCEWVTASEINNDYFTLERSANGYEFEALGTVAGAGTSTSTNSYYFIDASPLPGVSYYRLKQTDYDGQYAYSELRRVVVTGKEVLVFPTLVDDEVQVSLGVGGSYEMILTDLQGRSLIHESYVCQSDGPCLRTLQRGPLSAGLYHLTILSSGEKIAVEKLVFR